MKSRQTQEQIIVFTRYPEPGTTKTRLAKATGDKGAAAIQKKLTEQTLSQVRLLLHLSTAEVSIAFEGGSLEQMRKWLGFDFNYQAQGCGDLGQRMADAFAAAFKRGYARIVIIGTDCPGLQAAHLMHAFELLDRKDLVLGPAADGGYYLIGLKRVVEPVFAGIEWGRETVLAETLQRIQSDGLTCSTLPLWYDVDDARGLSLLRTLVLARQIERSDRLHHVEKVLAKIPRRPAA